MALPTLAELLTLPTQQEVLDQEVLPELRVQKVRVTDWKIGSVYRGISFVVSKLRVESRKAIAAIAAAGFADYAFGLVDAPLGIDVTDWAPLVAKQIYGIDRIEATFTKRKLTLINSTGTPYGPLNAGALRVVFTATGNRYILDESGVTIPASGSVQAVFRSEFPVDSKKNLAYLDGTGATIVLVTSNFPGVTVTNPAPTYSAVAQSGSGLGTVTPSGSPTGDHSVAVRIDTTGNIATIAWSTSLDGGAFVARSGSSLTNLGGFGINITLADNGGNPAFVAGTVYYFTTPGNDVSEVGRDVETPQELGARCKALIPLIAVQLDASGNAVPVSPTQSGYELLARKASTQVKVAFITIGTVNNEVRIYIAGQGALLDASVIAAVQNFLNSRNMVTDKPLVLSPTTRAITLAGATVTVKQAAKTTAQQAAQRALQLYFGGVDPKLLLSVNGRIDHAYVCSLLRNTAGVTKFTDTTLTINGSAGDYQLPGTPGAFELAAYTQDVATALTWSTE